MIELDVKTKDSKGAVISGSLNFGPQFGCGNCGKIEFGMHYFSHKPSKHHMFICIRCLAKYMWKRRNDLCRKLSQEKKGLKDLRSPKQSAAIRAAQNDTEGSSSLSGEKS